MSDGEEELALHLKAAKIPFEREFRFFPPRRFRFDFILVPLSLLIAIEVDGGSWNGGHRRGREADSECEKTNLAMEEGWKVYHFTPAMVSDGRALETIETALGREGAAPDA